MKILNQILKGTTAAISFALLSSSNVVLADNDLQFRPEKLETKFYEIGFRNSTSGKLVSVFSNSEGVPINLATQGGLNTLASGMGLTDSGTFDQMYVLVSNTVSLSGTAYTGCFIKSGDVSYSNGDFNIGTTNSALAGTTNLTETGFNGVYDLNDTSTYASTNPAVTTTLNGVQTTNLALYLVNKDTKIPGLGGTINGYLFLGSLANEISLNSSKEGTLWVDVDSSEAIEVNNGKTGGCNTMNWQNTKFGLSVEQ